MPSGSDRGSRDFLFGDPSFVTAEDDYEDLLVPTINGSKVTYSIDFTRADEFAALDCHLRSSAGYVLNSGEAGPATDENSQAIDKGDPESDWTLEPEPNGSHINLGAYGNTPEASKTSVGQPRILSASVTCPGGVARPVVSLEMGIDSGVDYNAFVKLVCKTGDVTVAEKSFEGVRNGDTVTYLLPCYFADGVRVDVAYEVTASSATKVSDTVSGVVSGTRPAFFGHGGGPTVVHVRAGADCLCDGSSWEHAYPDVQSALAAVTDDKTAVWVSEGTFDCVISVSRAAPLAVMGGFTGVEDTPAERAPGRRTTLDNANEKDGLVIASDAAVRFECIDFRRMLKRAIRKTGRGDLTVTDCGFYGNGGAGRDIAGHGISIDGSSAATLVVSNCAFAGNCYLHLDTTSGTTAYENAGDGCGVAVESCARAYFDDTAFVTNGVKLNTTQACYMGNHKGSALYASATPVTVRNCRFAGNVGGVRSQSSACDGGTVVLEGACGGSAFTNCAFVGNMEMLSMNDGYTQNGGAVVVLMDSASAKVDFANCTFAYNLTQGKYSPGGLNVVKGDATVRNTVFFGNVRGYKDTSGITTGWDADVKKDGKLTIRYSSVTGGEKRIAGYTGTSVDSDGTLSVLDPQFVTPFSDVEAQIVTSDGWRYYRTDAYAALAAFDVHLLSVAGYCVNGGAAGPATTAISSAIDGGGPLDDCHLEPEPNGGRVNLGYCGGTERASKTSVATPVVNEVTVDCPNGHTQPRAIISMGATSPTDIYSATVTVECYLKSNPGERFTTVYPNVGNGTVITNWVPWCYQNGDDVQIDVKVAAPGVSDITVTSDLTVTGEVDPSFQKGGGADVIHVRAGATGLNNGSDWFHAYTDIRSAFQSLGAKREIWIARTGAVRCPDMVLVNAATLEAIRGGFAGVEETADARDGLGRTVFDAQTEDANAFRLANGTDLELDGLEFVNARERGLYKTGDGGITLVDCAFRWNGAKLSTLNERGSGAYLTGSSSASAVIANCRFEGNVMRSGAPNANNFGLGGALCVTTFNSLELVGTQFLTNGVAPEADTGSNTLGRDGFKGSAVYVKGVPVTMRDCEFRGNRGTCREGERGGCVRLEGACGGSVIDHCLWLGNYEMTGWNNNRCDSTCTGALVLNLDDAASAVTVRNSTIAYNLSGYYTAAAGISVAKGTLDLVDSIVFGNRLASGATVGSDLALTVEEIEQLKERNDWGKPLDESKMTAYTVETTDTKQHGMKPAAESRVYSRLHGQALKHFSPACRMLSPRSGTACRMLPRPHGMQSPSRSSDSSPTCGDTSPRISPAWPIH